VPDDISRVLEHDERIAYAIRFGSTTTGRAHRLSDVDVAIGLRDGRGLSALEVGELAARLEAAAGRAVDLVLLDEAPPGLAYRIFRDGEIITVRDRPTLAARRARAILEYLDFRPIEELCTRGVLKAADGR
jgi:hypothetical protein